MSAKTVFISYRRDPTGKLFARSIKEALTHFGYDVFLDVDCLDAGKWAAQILTQVPLRAHFLLLLTPSALDRCVQEDDWVRKELLTAIDSKRNIVPVREESVNLGELNKCCPECVKALFDYQIATIQHAGFEADMKMLVERFIPPHKAPAPKTESVAGKPHTIRADLSRILKYAPADLIGRDDETKLLNDAWTKPQNSSAPRPHVLTLVALGGEGKTSLVSKWAAELAAQDWPGCDAAFAWSFYSQGTKDQVTASSDLFLKEALTFFGDAADQAFAASPAGAFEKGQRLARLVGQRRCLLILDGLEPLQYAPTAPTPGELKDQGLAALLKGLAAASHGLCVVTTRYSLPDLRAFWQTTAPEVKLLRLSRDAGVHLLKNLGVRGSELRNLPLKDGDEKSEEVNEFEKLVEDVKGHALTLTLLGGFLKRAFHGDIRQRDRVKFEKADEEIDGGHAFRVLDAYVNWLEPRGFRAWLRRLFSESERKTQIRGRRFVAVLRLMGLFDRPADAGCLAALRRETIPGLTEPLAGLADDDWEYCLSGLETAKLLTVNRDASGALVSLDAHPHLREYFARQLRTQQPDAWRAAHCRLYEHLCATTKEGDQPKLEDLQPLYQAVAHGCQAGLQQEAHDEVHFKRIRRQNEYYAWRKLGAFGSELGAVACFFKEPWSSVAQVLRENDQAVLLEQAAFCLRALGRLAEARDPIRISMQMGVARNEWEGAAISASNLSELELTLGEVAGAVGDAEQSVTYADRSGDAGMRMIMRTTHADALHQAGRRAEAETRFREAEQMQQERQPDYPLLYSLQGFQYCDLLLTEAERAAWQRTLEWRASVLDCASPLALSGGVGSSGDSSASEGKSGGGPPHSKTLRDVRERAAQTLKIAEDNRLSLLTIALDHLTLGRAALYAAVLERSAAVSAGPAAATPNMQSATGSSTAFFPTEAAADGASPTPALQALPTARRELDAAVTGLRRAGHIEFVVRALLTRAWLRLLEGQPTGPESAQEDLDEAWEIAERGPMRLFMADVLLTRCRLFGMTKPEWRMTNGEPLKYPWESAEQDLAAAEKLIEQCGYGRRRDELADAKRALGGVA